jgi:hypothetical protein
LSQTRYESDVGQTRCKESIRAGLRVCPCSLDYLNDYGVAILLARSLEKDVCPSIDEETDTGGVGGLPRSPDTIGLLDFFSELFRWPESYPLGCSLLPPLRLQDESSR